MSDSLREFLESDRLENELLKSSSDESVVPPLNLNQSPQRKKKGLLRFSPKRLISSSTPSSPITSRRSLESIDFNEEKERPRRSSLNFSPLRKSQSNISSPGSLKISPLRKSKSAASVTSAPAKKPISKLLLCHQCRRGLKYDLYSEKFLAVKCPCPQPPFFHCSRECQRIHWISLHGDRDQCLHEKSFPEVGFNCQIELTWEKEFDEQYQFRFDQYVSCSFY